MPPGFPSDTFMPPASDENWKAACRNGQELSNQSNSMPCFSWSLKSIAWLYVVSSALNPVLFCVFLLFMSLT